MEETVDGTSQDVLAAATREAAYLTDKEREAILAVLTKDEQLRRQQQVKVLHLKAELQSLRRKGALKVSEDSYQDPDRTCGRCRADLGRVINRGASCTSCRLKVCKACREYNFRATDWVCTVCYKRMEIQAASGEWMNEFVRRPSRRRDARVYVPAADIIKRTIRRSWTISNPSPRWTALRTSPELRPYNSLPRGQDISNYPSLVGIRSTDTPRRSSPQRRTKSEDVYHENKDNPGEDQIPKRPVRVNPLMSISLRETKEEKARRKSPRAETVVEVVVENEDKTKEEHERENPVKCKPSRAEDEPDKVLERHVSFDSSKPGPDLASFRSRSLSQSKSNKDMKKVPFTTRSLPEESTIKDENEDGVGCGDHNPSAATNAPPAELLCDIEPISGTVFRKMTVRRRRQENMRKLPAVDAGWRRPPDPDLQDILLPDGEDYRLVFVNSDGSSKEEEVDDNDSSSASSFPIDDCDWDYFEPGAAAKTHPAIGWTSPFGSPTVFRKRGAVGDSPLGSPLLHRRPRASSDEDGPPSETPANPLGTPPLCLHRSAIGRQQTVQTSHPTTASTCCKTCGGNSGAQYIPIPVPVPIPFPVPWNNHGSAGGEVKVPLYRPMPDLGARGAEFWQYLSQMPGFPWGFLEKPMIGENREEDKGKSGDEEGVENEEEDNRGEEEEEPRGHLECENRGSSASESSSTDSSADEGDRPRVRRVYNVTGPPSTRESDDALPSSEVSSDDAKSSADEQEREEEAEDEDDTSSGSADTDSNDTGTVADQKPRHFSRVFVVNHKDSSGSVTSSNGDTDSSDNDTDLELDCSVVLTNIKQIDSEENVEEDGNNDEVVGGGASFLGIRYIGEDEESRRPVKESRRRSRARRKGKKSKVEENNESETDEEEVKLAKELEKEPSSSKVDLEEADEVSGEGASFLDIGHLAENEESKKTIKETRRKSRTRRKGKNSKVEENNKCETEEIEVKLAKGLEKKPSSSNTDSEENVDEDKKTEEGASSFLGSRHLAEDEEGKKPIKETRRKSRDKRKDTKSTDQENNESETEKEEVKLAKGLEKRPSSSNAGSEENVDDDERIEEGASFLGTRHLDDDEEGKRPVKESRRKSRTRRKDTKSKDQENNESAMEKTEVKLAKELEKDPSLSNADSEESVYENKNADEVAGGGAIFMEYEESKSLVKESQRKSRTRRKCTKSQAQENNESETDKEEVTLAKEKEPSSSNADWEGNVKEADNNDEVAGGGHLAEDEESQIQVKESLRKSWGRRKGKKSKVDESSESEIEEEEIKLAKGLEMTPSSSNSDLEENMDEVEGTRHLEESKRQVKESRRKSRTRRKVTKSKVEENNESESEEEEVNLTKEFEKEPSSSNAEREDCDNETNEESNNNPKFPVVYSSSPGLSDVSAETLSSSDAEKEQCVATGEGEATSCVRQRETEPVGAEVRAGGLPPPSVIGEPSNARHGVRYTSLVMIRNDESASQQVNVVSAAARDVVVVRHTNREERHATRPSPFDKPSQTHSESNVTVITSPETLSAFEEGLADDDSWVENLSGEEEEEEDDFPTNSISENSSSGDEVTLTCSAAIDQEDELRGYHRPIDFTLHTIVEESCEESEVEQAPQKTRKERPASATDLEKYFFFGLGDGTVPSLNSNREDAFSETSSIYSEGMESLGGGDDNQNDNSEELASSRLEKYFLSGFMGFTAERRDSDGSVGSDSEGRPSPEQRRKRLVRARGTGRSHSSSLDNLLANPDLAGSDQQMDAQNSEAAASSSDSDAYDEVLGFEKSDGQFDTVKRKKGKKQKASLEDVKNLETTQEEQELSDEDDDRNKTPQPEVLPMPSNLTTNKNQQSRDSGFVGSCDDLLKDQRDVNKSPDISLLHEKSTDVFTEKREEKIFTESYPPATNLTRKDSFNNWSSDEETNLMMCKMRQFFKTMVAANSSSSSKPTTPTPGGKISPRLLPRGRGRCKPPQLVYFENELTRLMKTVPGIRDDQVREIVEYLSSEDTWSDSYDSSDYTSSDLEGTSTKSALQQQISDSCQQIINKFDSSADDKEGDAGDGGIAEDGHGINKETALVYQKLVASFEKMATEDPPQSVSGPNSPPLIAKVMHHIGSRLVALMHEVSSGESHASNSPKARGYHRRLQQKLSNASTTTTDEDSTSDTNLPDTFVEESMSNYNILPRSRSHDLLMGDTGKNQSIGGASEISEEREASDCERFSWRGSFESALLATDSRNKLSLIGGEGSASASALAIAAKRRSAGDLLFSHKSLSREQLDRVRSCGSIGGGNSEDKLWVAPASRPGRRRSSVPDAASCGSGASADGEDEDDDLENRSTLPRSMQSGPQTTNSLPRLPTTSLASIQKAQSHHFLPQNAKSARYRPPGFSRLMPTQPKRAASAPGLQPSHQRRGRRSQHTSVPSDDVSLSEAHSSPMLVSSRGGSKSATPSPVAPGSRRKTNSMSSQEWPGPEDDIDRLVAMHHNRSSLSSLGLRSDSMASVYSGAGEGRYGSVTVRGQVEFGLQYNYKASALEIQIKQCKDLAPVDSKRNRSDPYVKVYLLPDKSKSGKRKTKVKKHTLNPVFDECLKFQMSLNELELRTLWLTVWHSDMFGRNDFLGEVMMALENKVFDDPTPRWYNLQERTEPFDDVLSFKGDIIVCLKFVPPDMTVHKKGKRSRGALHVLIKEAKALTAVKANGTSDPFCKSYLLPEKGRSSKQKTPVVRRTVNPVWNHTFIYDDVTLQELSERCLELTVWDHDRLASNEFLGGVRFSLGTGKHYGKSVEWMDATGKEVSLWKSMLERPNFWVEGCLPLRPTLDARAS